MLGTSCIHAMKVCHVGVILLQQSGLTVQVVWLHSACWASAFTMHLSMWQHRMNVRGLKWRLCSAQLSGSAGSQDLGSDKIVTITDPVLPTGAAAAPARPASKLSTSSSANADPSDSNTKIYKMPSIGVLKQCWGLGYISLHAAFLWLMLGTC